MDEHYPSILHSSPPKLPIPTLHPSQSINSISSKSYFWLTATQNSYIFLLFCRTHNAAKTFRIKASSTLPIIAFGILLHNANPSLVKFVKRRLCCPILHTCLCRYPSCILTYRERSVVTRRENSFRERVFNIQSDDF